MYSRKQLIILMAEALIIMVLLFAAIPAAFASINTRSDKKPVTTTISNRKDLASISDDVYNQIIERLTKLAAETPGYSAGTYTASAYKDLAGAYYFELTPSDSKNIVTVYVSVSGFNDAEIYMDGKMIGSNYIPNLYKANQN